MNTTEVECKNCGETWDETTLGYEEAKACVDRTGGFCPACEFPCSCCYETRNHNEKDVIEKREGGQYD